MTRGSAKERVAVMGDQCERDLSIAHVLAQAAGNVAERSAFRLPPRLPDPHRDGVEEFRALAQIGDFESKRH